MAEDGGDLVAARALDVHEVAVGMLHQALQLVLALLLFGTRVEQVLRKLKRERNTDYHLGLEVALTTCWLFCQSLF